MQRAATISCNATTQTSSASYASVGCQAAHEPEMPPLRSLVDIGTQTEQLPLLQTARAATPCLPMSSTTTEDLHTDDGSVPSSLTSLTLTNFDRRSGSPMEIESPTISPSLWPTSVPKRDPITGDIIPKLEELDDLDAKLVGTIMATMAFPAENGDEKMASTVSRPLTPSPRSPSPRSRSSSFMSLSSEEYEPPPATPLEQLETFKYSKPVEGSEGL